LMALSEAAALIDEHLIFQLVSQIPQEHEILARFIQQLVNNFDFDRLMHLAQEAAKA
jgi:hypothetical protein